MTQKTFETAKQLEARIEHIAKVIDLLGFHAYELDPPTRQTRYDIQIREKEWINLNEGEVVFLKKALLEEKDRLIQEFNNL